MIHRTYIVLMPESGNLDILVDGPVGSRTAPVGSTATPAPSGWNGGASGRFYEQLGRTLRFELLSGATGFVPRANLGFRLSVTRLMPQAVAADVPAAVLSASLVTLGDGTDITVTALADPSYGGRARPVIRLIGGGTIASGVFLVDFGIVEPKDEIRDEQGV